MNERIRALLSQCTHESIDGHFATPYVDQEKFAGLIVQECTRIIATQALESLNIDLVEYNALVGASSQIKKHFGVK